jgi:hypothetical protein
MREEEQNEGRGHQLVSVLTALLPFAPSLLPDPTHLIKLLLNHSRAPLLFLQPKEGPAEESRLKEELLRLWLSLTTILVAQGPTEEERQVMGASLPHLLQAYGATRSPSDLIIFDLLSLYPLPPLSLPLETLPLFGHLCTEKAGPQPLNPLHAHANRVLGGLKERKAFHTALLYDPLRPAATSASYDLAFLLPLLNHLLDESNVADAGKVVANGWVYFIARGMSLEDEKLRALAFLAFSRLTQHFSHPKVEPVPIPRF